MNYGVGGHYHAHTDSAGTTPEEIKKQKHLPCCYQTDCPIDENIQLCCKMCRLVYCTNTGGPLEAPKDIRRHVKMLERSDVKYSGRGIGLLSKKVILLDVFTYVCVCGGGARVTRGGCGYITVLHKFF